MATRELFWHLQRVSFGLRTGYNLSLESNSEFSEQMMIVGGRDRNIGYHLKTEIMGLTEDWKVVADYPYTPKIRVGALVQGSHLNIFALWLKIWCS